MVTSIVVLQRAWNHVVKVIVRGPMPNVVKVLIVRVKVLIVPGKALIAPVRKANVAKGANGPKKANVSKQIPL